MDTPERYKRFLEERGGKNIIGEPNFLLNWGSSALVRLAIPDQFRNPYTDCWALCEWVPPEEFGSPEEWDERQLGPYPSRGAYDPRVVFKRDGKPDMIDSEHLNLQTLEMYLWVILNHKHDSLQKRVQFLKDDRARIKAEETRRLVDRIEGGAPAFLDSVSFTGQLNCNSVVKQKLDYLEKHLDRITNIAARFPRGGVMQA